MCQQYRFMAKRPRDSLDPNVHLHSASRPKASHAATPLFHRVSLRPTSHRLHECVAEVAARVFVNIRERRATISGHLDIATRTGLNPSLCRRFINTCKVSGFRLAVDSRKTTHVREWCDVTAEIKFTFVYQKKILTVL